MADEGDGQLKLNENAGGGKKKKLLLIIIVVVILAGAGAFFFLRGSSDPAEGEKGGANGEGGAGSVAKEVIYYVPIKEPFIFTAKSRPKGHLVQIKLVLMVKGDNNKALAEHHQGAIKGAITKYLADIQYASLVDNNGKAEFKKSLLKVIQGKMNSIEREPVVDQVLYDGFVIQ